MGITYPLDHDYDEFYREPDDQAAFEAEQRIADYEAAVAEFLATPGMSDAIAALGPDVAVLEPYPGDARHGPDVELEAVQRGGDVRPGPPGPSVTVHLMPDGTNALARQSDAGLEKINAAQAADQLGVSRETFQQARDVIGQGLERTATAAGVTEWKPLPIFADTSRVDAAAPASRSSSISEGLTLAASVDAGAAARLHGAQRQSLGGGAAHPVINHQPGPAR